MPLYLPPGRSPQDGRREALATAIEYLRQEATRLGLPSVAAALQRSLTALGAVTRSPRREK